MDMEGVWFFVFVMFGDVLIVCLVMIVVMVGGVVIYVVMLLFSLIGGNV